mmetsp:Transcript_24171/g.33384  ORF Transcript_24171/g.33384 Transcript_24171/m.33384 type:complete len:352 (+) Transcript_24171:220-1275(+)
MRRQAEKQQHLLGERRMNSQKEKPTLSSQRDNHQQRPTAGNVGRSRSLEAGRPGSRRRRHHRWSSAALELERGVAPVLNGHVAHDHVRSSHVRVHVQRRQVAHAQVAPHLALARAQVAPGHVALLDHLHRVGAVHAALLQAEDVRGLAVGDLVRAEPLAHVVHHAGQQPLHVVDVVQLGGPPVLLVNADQLPVRLAVVDEAEHAQHLHAAHAGRLHDAQPDLAHVQRVVVAAHAHVRVHVRGVLPGARQAAVVEEDVALLEGAQLALLRVLLDGVARLVRGDLVLLAAAAGDFADKVYTASRHACVGICAVQGHIMPQRNLCLVSILTFHNMSDSVVKCVGFIHALHHHIF